MAKARSLTETLRHEQAVVSGMYDNIIDMVNKLTTLTGTINGHFEVNGAHALTGKRRKRRKPRSVETATLATVAAAEPAVQPKKKRRMSRAAREATSIRMKKYWANRRKEKKATMQVHTR